MRHARPEALDRLKPVLAALRAMPDLTERSRGVFYRRSRAFLHFHEDGADLFADLRKGADFERFRVTASSERAAFLRTVRGLLKD
jgi:hypothetical protein